MEEAIVQTMVGRRQGPVLGGGSQTSKMYAIGVNLALFVPTGWQSQAPFKRQLVTALRLTVEINCKVFRYF